MSAARYELRQYVQYRSKYVRRLKLEILCTQLYIYRALLKSEDVIRLTFTNFFKF